MTRLFLYFFILFFAGTSIEMLAQKKNRRAPYMKNRAAANKSNAGGTFSETQLWLGLKGGINTAKATPTERYSVFTSTVSTDEDKKYEKEYEGFSKIGYQFGMVFNFNFQKYLSLSFQPEFTNMKFGYKNNYKWDGENNNSVELTQKHRFSMNYLELPLLLRFDILRTRFRPYVEGGLYYRTLLKADKNVEYTSIDNASGAKNPIENTYPTVGANDLFIKSSWGYIAGLGFNYDLGNVRLGLDATYKIGVNNITNEKNRYSDDRLTSIGDALDGLKTQNIAVSFSVVFPMKYLETGFFKKVNP